MAYIFGKQSLERQEGVHPIMRERAERVLSYGILDVTIPKLGGARTLEDQRGLVSRGASQTLNSLHRIQKSTGFAHALDAIPYPVDWKDIARFNMLGTLMFRAAMEDEYDVPLEWGGHWRNFKDYPHFQFPRGFKG